MEKVYERFRSGGMMALLDGRFAGGTVHDLNVDPQDPNIIYAACDHGILKLTNSGTVWKIASEGLEISRAYNIFTFAFSGKIYAGTPSGLFESKNSGEHWRNSNLVLIFQSNSRREVGSADYLDAYWRGRYFNFITQEQAEAEMDK